MTNTLSELMDFELSFRCRCGRFGAIKVRDVITRFGGKATAANVLAKVRCTGCGQLGQPDVRLVFDHPSTPTGGYRGIYGSTDDTG